MTITIGSITSVSASGASGIDLDTFYDNFNDNSMDGSLWSQGSFAGNDAGIVVSEADGHLAITPLTGQTGLHYNGVTSSRAYDLTQGTIFVEVVESTRGQADTTFAFGTDNNNKAIMETESGSLHMRLVVSGSNVGAVSVSYNGTVHRWWRIRHVASDNTIRFETSPDGITWTQRHSISRSSLNISAGKVNLSAGTWNSQSDPGRALFDNLSWHPLVPNKGDWSTATTAINPNPTVGTWDNILWGAASPSTMVKLNGTYFMYYIGAAGDTGDPEYNPIRRSLGVATSSNGVNFTKFGSNPILTYTTTNGTVPEEGVGGATAIVVGNTIHLYYAAIRSTGGEQVDLDIRYRKSTDGYTFTNDTLIYRSPGDEYSPLGVTYNGSTWSVYIKGPLTSGKGQLSRLSGASPTNLPNKTSVSTTTFGSGGNADYISQDVFVLHLDRREPAEDRFQVRAINKNSPDAISEPLFSYTFGNFGDHATPLTFKDQVTGNWFMYTLDLTNSPAVISVRTYSPAVVTNPTGTPPVTSTNTPVVTPTPVFTSTPGAASGIHVSDLEGHAEPFGKNWRATVTITVHDVNHNPLANARVEGVWGGGFTGNDSCVTNSSGSCSITTRKAGSNSTTVTFTITNVSYASQPYLSSTNHDADGDSNGTTITILKP
jgi:hypothetical protein